MAEEIRKIKYDLSDKVALITGGASGLGLATAKRMLESGAKVVIADYSDKGAEVAEEIGALFIKTDVTKEDDIKAAVNKAVEEFGKLDICVASAGIGGISKHIDDELLANWQKVNDVDYTGIMLTNKHAIQQMRLQGKGGAIINLASMFGLVAVPDNIAYSSAKGGVVNMTHAAGCSYPEEGIRVNAVCPGVIDTPLIPEDQKVVYRKLHPARRLGASWEVASLITFLASDEASFITGAAIPIDGGYTAI
ncbi:SDR family NAD(P)-dependent oxidoreductase [Arcanobacterium hippocoleae]|uniref:NAD(P)-dependent dehydrogenase (Short-subunit alcohol dehydrogenase family) n=1 Tax=Arcanobacterium hippocoleae TaxID=149017 RepID=A0ABU1T0S4_9ACTO|nr:SDR family oxidoreductase [Arcanobacterium hippocoleae]MDR6938900.1 NAD(P)-dependent dehydrogenase (short-subunit alcohol dehydrogenase family) [Arcanobacterium hippocoleae]